MQHFKLLSKEEGNCQSLKIRIICKSLNMDYSASIWQLLHSKYRELCLNDLIVYFSYLVFNLDTGCSGLVMFPSGITAIYFYLCWFFNPSTAIKIHKKNLNFMPSSHILNAQQSHATHGSILKVIKANAVLLLYQRTLLQTSVISFFLPHSVVSVFP